MSVQTNLRTVPLILQNNGLIPLHFLVQHHCEDMNFKGERTFQLQLSQAHFDELTHLVFYEALYNFT